MSDLEGVTISEQMHRLGYEYDVLRCAWYHRSAVTIERNGVKVNEPARLAIPPFGITDRELYERLYDH